MPCMSLVIVHVHSATIVGKGCIYSLDWTGLLDWITGLTADSARACACTHSMRVTRNNQFARLHHVREGRLTARVAA